MNENSNHWIDTLGLSPHPEGGYFREIFRSPLQVTWRDEQLSASTAIYFLLQSGDRSWCHRIPQDEVWHFYEGDPFELIWFNEKDLRLHQQILSPAHPLAIVPGGWWQSAQTTGSYSLIGCTVAPGFEFRLFELLSTNPEKRERFRTLVNGFAERDN